MKLIKSKKVRDGLFVKIKGNKIVVCSKKPIGVYKKEDNIINRYIDMDGNSQIICNAIPEGIYFYGKVDVRISGKD